MKGFRFLHLVALWFKKESTARTARPRRRQDQQLSLCLEHLEARLAPATLVVNSSADNTTDTSHLTLRDAITLVNNAGNPSSLGQSSMPSGWAAQITGTFGTNDTIHFNLGGTAPFIIEPTSQLPTITSHVDIDASTQPGYSSKPVVELSGSLAGTAEGLVITAANSTIKALDIINFSDDAIWLQSNGSDVIQGNFIGVDPTGTALESNGGSGVLIWSPNNTIGGGTAGARNVIAGTGYAGVSLHGTSATGNDVQGNYIGLNVTGSAILGAFAQCISLEAGASSNLIGTNGDGVNDAAEGNVLDGAQYNGISIYNGGTDNNIIAGNDIGTDATGEIALGNLNGIVFAYLGATGQTGNRIGASASDADPAAERNVISGNTNYGVYVGLANDSQNVIAGNYIGTDANGTMELTNGFPLFIAGANNTVGGTTASTGNLISGNAGAGINISGTTATGNVVEGNDIGTNAAGTAALANNNDGVLINGGASNNIIGGTSLGTRNVISGNSGVGVAIEDTGTTGNEVLGNYIGTNAAGNAALGNGYGVYISGGATGNTIGGQTPFAPNVISGNVDWGLWVDGSTTLANTLLDNVVGSTASLSNLFNGSGTLVITDSAVVPTAGTFNGSVNDSGTIDLAGNNVSIVGAFTGSGTVTNSAASGTNTLTVDGTGTFGGVIQNGATASTALTVDGDTLTLTGTNTWSGATTISAGTLQIGNGGTTGSLGSAAVTDNSALVFDLNSSVTIGNIISGSGAVTQDGSGTVTIPGAGGWNGTTSITVGTLTVNGSILESTLTVSGGGTLDGTGTTGGTTVTGTLKPAMPTTTGTLTTGNLSFNAGGTLDINMFSSGSDKLVVDGTATLGSATLNVHTVSGYYISGPVVILQSTAGISGTFTNGGTVTGSGGQVYIITYGAQDVTLSPPPLVLTTSTLSSPVNAGVAYSQTITGYGGEPAYNFALTSGSLPNGLALNGSTGAITGAPTTPVGSPFNFTITLTDAAGVTVSHAYTIAVNPIFVVSSTSGNPAVVGSLPWAVNQTYGNPGPYFIHFDIPGSGTQVITITSSLWINEQTVIDGTTQPGYTGTPLISVQGASGVPGLVIFNAGSTGSTLQGLDLYSYSVNAVTILDTSVQDYVQDNYIGFSGGGNLDYYLYPPQSGYQVTGVAVQSSDDTIRGNTISGNYNGVAIGGNPAVTCIASGLVDNMIGTDPTGTTDAGYGNYANGFFLSAGAQGNCLGPYNVLSGNGNNGAELLTASATQNVLFSSYVGTDITGTQPIPNGWNGNGTGVLIADGAYFNCVGGPFGGNIISANDGTGVVLGNSTGAANTNFVQYNVIGLSGGGLTGLVTNVVGTQVGGVSISNGSSTNLVAFNVIAGTTINGVAITGAQGNNISNNWLGENAIGVSHPDAAFGIALNAGASYNYLANNYIGGTGLGAYYIDPQAIGNNFANGQGQGLPANLPLGPVSSD